MNIHFTDKALFENLKMATLVRIRVGSHMYGTNDAGSDEDFLYIYATSDAELNSFVWTNHQLQYKENGVDYNFVSLHTFIRNCINGDSTINFEVIQSRQLASTALNFLDVHRSSFCTYTIMRSYLGFARRDLKHWAKASTERDRKKKLMHIVRGYLYAKRIKEMNGAGGSAFFDFDAANNELREIGKTLEATHENAKAYGEKVDALRKEMNYMLDNSEFTLAKNMDVMCAKMINDELIKFMGVGYWEGRSHYLRDFDMGMFINAFENWVEYD